MTDDGHGLIEHGAKALSSCLESNPMANPVVVEATRGERVESAHRGAGAVVDADGRVVMSFGDAGRPVYPRSAVKALQALPLVESGAADRLGLSDKEIALACASHSGGEDHVATARAMLAKAGLTSASSNAASTGRSARTRRERSRARAGRRPLCTTIARANMRASSVSPAPWELTRRAMSRRIIPCSARSRR